MTSNRQTCRLLNSTALQSMALDAFEKPFAVTLREAVKKATAQVTAASAQDVDALVVVLPPALYDRAEAEGVNMRGYVRQAPWPKADSGIYKIEAARATSRL